ncbi:HipA domain-containing protein [Agromyces sp. Soil535]|uniref:HipA domain-containing protein n=1 Tax=Agromyces sp. Soil535 TaxID=1736390 RepID=UPI001F40DDAD|nr:HipA domain-containing protein [Agromyces sp. Soil535]
MPGPTMRELAVELYGQLVGHLLGDDWRRFEFRAAADAFERFELGSTVLSEAIPLVPTANRAHSARRRNFFAELLPEGDLLTDLATQARLPEYDVPGLLARFGRDVAGALQIYDPAQPGEPREPRSMPVTEREIARMLRDPIGQPLGNLAPAGKTSLNGVQPKAVLAQVDGEWHRVLDGYPSTHILKPRPDRYPTMIFDEEYGLRIGRRLGLLDYGVTVTEFAGLDTLVIERYDRAEDSPTGRVHQEDFCQALAIPRTQKYQEQGGAASLARVQRLLATTADAASVARLARLMMLAVALGDVDLHLKNLALLHPYRSAATLAPAYDLVPLMHQPNDGRLALAVNGVYRHADVTLDDLERELGSWSPRLSELARPTLERIEQFVEEEVPHPEAYPALRDDVARFTRNLLDGRPAGWARNAG